MAVTIEKKFEVPEPVEKVWAFLSNPRKVVTCVPGAQITEQIDENTYKGAISVKVGPSVSDYKGQVQIVRIDPSAHEIEILGKGQDTRGKGSASMKMTGKLRPLDGGGTEVISVSELGVVGILAQMGGRMINEVSNIMFNQFTTNFRQKLASGDASESSSGPKPIGAVGLAFSALKASLAGKTSPPQSASGASEAGTKPGEESGGKP
ncbi:MAG TPA: SRPBCC family protein [Candidatus Angelobacter sp.]|nr:SRPBCC family protein [Candidatus Angelobacter sp.]